MNIKQTRLASLFLILGLTAASHAYASTDIQEVDLSEAEVVAEVDMAPTDAPELEAVAEAELMDSTTPAAGAAGAVGAEGTTDAPQYLAAGAMDEAAGAMGAEGTPQYLAAGAMDEVSGAEGAAGDVGAGDATMPANTDDMADVEAEVHTACLQAAEDDQIAAAEQQSFVDNCVADNLAATAAPAEMTDTAEAVDEQAAAPADDMFDTATDVASASDALDLEVTQ